MNMNMNRLMLSVTWILLTLASLPSLFAQDSDWPRTVPLKQGMVTIYSLQVDEMSENIIQFRAALAYRASAGAEPVFGAGWFESPVKIDSANRIVHPTQLTVTETRFPAGTDDIQPELASVLAQQSAGWNLDFSLDELDTALAAADAEAKAVSTTPPDVIYRDHPALLVSIDGEPVLREIENSTYQAVINTPYPLIFDGKYYYLNAATDVWYRARKATGPYQFVTTPPKAIAAMVKPDETATAQEQALEPITAANAPEIVVSTRPAELIVTEGPAAFVPLVDDLLVLQNSDDDVFMHVSSQKFYIVLAGRWYQAGSLTGPWLYQSADELPTAFANIPRDSNQADSRVYVAGTEEAKDAVLDAYVPQTAAVKRGEVDIEVKYDGEPVYQPVDGTDLVYIQNTGSTVLVSGGLYYLVEEGVWYVSSNRNGPWQVSDHRPAQVDTILPTSPVYNTKYVHVYDSTPSVVYVGYTPGYTGSYVYHNTLFYGTGWYYRPWVSPYYYYPRFSTWGFNVSYNSWYGWNFGLSWGWGPFNVGYYSGGYWHHNHYWHHPHHGRWGPGRYRHRPVHHRNGHDRYAHSGYRSGGNSRYDGRYDDRRYDNSRDRGGNARPRGNEQNYNLYRDESQRARVANTRDRQPQRQDGYAVDTKRVSTRDMDGRRVQSYAGKSKAERNRAGPVSPTELRTKASVRDVNLEASRSRMVADNGGKVYSKTTRKQDNKSYLGGVGNPERATNLASANAAKTRAPENRGARQSSPAIYTSARQPQQKSPQQKSSGNRQRAPTTVKTPNRQTQPQTPAYDSRQSSKARSKGAERPSQPKMPANSTRQRTHLVAGTPVRKTTQVNTGKYTGQQTARSAPTQVQRQSSAPKAAQPKSSRGSASRNSAPAQKAPQNSAKKASHQRSGSKSNNAGRRRD